MLVKFTNYTYIGRLGFFIIALGLGNLYHGFSQTLELTVDKYIKQVRENHPSIKVKEIDPEMKKTILEEEPLINGFGGNLSVNYKQNHTDSTLKSEQKILDMGWDYRMRPFGTKFGVNVNNTYTGSTGLWGSTLSFSVDQPLLYNGFLGDIERQIDIKRYDYEISKASHQITVTQIILQSLNTYWQYVHCWGPV